ncbi:MAG: hypothetical protein JGK17_02540 [Microcoleus sp. PH2017_10_PVI_O_A]|uniref:hypothetical protein n=1 Tax=unclassified Microcoleus TaxID=2642155 RepID=UPI001DB0D013|nr:MULTISPECIES: hypothetical protein [unclassified Microcoleus]TAE79787.1 MAG: hypothetical protein EAZ83_20250 [Oscillatoriales cyanobacterium]MCC3404464.1 hypothetical protein [Microcoleus sp. PH2017_10_PVI_O_A]MCC3462092.1 hypothetical protein [Microcoleus sp. PH2017_11_PCY_U_A]MCC3476782.1 hypothetical protein [Microcoleus sp. PH2017_12_PCY_D_A]MCC3526921.1 hypothetical protein [Microcoleus sp. PH2017_21_RUC_O_A]
MCNLRQSIVIYRCQNRELETTKECTIPRVWLSSGTQLAVDTSPDRLQYCEGAFMPKEPWREPTPAESTLLWADEPPPRYSGVGIVRLPADVLALLAASGIPSLTTPLQVAEFKSQEKCGQILDRLIDYFKPFCLSDSPPVISGMGGRQPGLSTATIDNKRGCRNGLHTDSWDNLPLAKKQEATNRICVNLGRDSRYFLFVNLTEMDIFEMLGGSDSDVGKPWTRQLTYEFMQRYGEYPVVKLRIAPGEAYIAPTENMIHDASTADMKHLDVKVMMRGYYRIPA